MVTPTTPQVIAAERVPPMFRPNNQANLVPAQPLNPAASQSFLPGLGQVRSGNVVSSNGLDPVGDEELAQWSEQAAKGRSRSYFKAKAAVAMLNRQKAAIQAKIDGAAARGVPLPRGELIKLRRMLRQIDLRVAAIWRTLRRQQGGGLVAPPWRRRARYRRGRRLRPLIAIDAPVTPDPLQLEPPGISYQTGQDTLRAMQASVSPVTAMDGLGQEVFHATVTNTGAERAQHAIAIQEAHVPSLSKKTSRVTYSGTPREAIQNLRISIRQMKEHLNELKRYQRQTPALNQPIKLVSQIQNLEASIAYQRKMIRKIRQQQKMDRRAGIDGLGQFAIPAPLILGGVAAGVIFLAARSGKRR